MSRKKYEAGGITEDRRKRPIEPKSPLARRLQEALGGSKTSEAARIFSCTWDTAKRYLSGAVQPHADALEAFIRATGCDGHWLLTGEHRGETGGGSAPLRADVVVGETVAGYRPPDVRVGDIVTMECVGPNRYAILGVVAEVRDD